MLIVDDVTNKIELTRGDTCAVIVSITDANGDIYELQTGDVLLFTMKLNCNTTDIVIQKDISEDSIIALSHNDTKSLNYGNYVYDVQLTQAGGDVYTVIPPSVFTIAREVTFNA